MDDDIADPLKEMAKSPVRANLMLAVCRAGACLRPTECLGQKVTRQLAATHALEDSPFVVALPMTESVDPETATSNPTPARSQSCW